MIMEHSIYLVYVLWAYGVSWFLNTQVVRIMFFEPNTGTCCVAVGNYQTANIRVIPLSRAYVQTGTDHLLA
jgi:hypothetical protein